MKLKSLCRRLSSGDRIDACDISETGMYPVFGGNGIRGYTNKYNFDGRCAIIGRQGANCGNVKYYEGKAFMTEHAIVVDTFDSTDVGYLSYKLSLLNLSRLQGQSAQPGLAVGTIADIDIEMPTIDIQRKIWSVLHSIDIKIDNNNQINNNLEELMKTFYQRWFIEFNFPNEEGKPYKASGGKIVYNELLKREIPEGWQVDKLINQANLYQPQTLSDKELVENGQFYVYGAGGIMGKYDKYNHNDREIIISCRGNCGQTRMTIPKSWINGNSMVVHNKNKNQEYLYYTLYILGVDKTITGSVQKQITRTNLEDYKIIIPNESILENFEKIASTIREEQETIFYENERMTSIRDFLLPMLMNGQINVDDII